MSHSKGIYDTDLHFVIDPVTRTIRNESGKVTIIQYDHNSERFTFEIPRYIDGHDMSECNRVEVHYNNIATGQTNRGLYEVTDLQVSPEDSRYVICSWLISQNATRLVGRLAFVVRFACITLDGEEGGEDDYAWNTSPYGDIKIVSGIYNTEEVVYEYADVLMQWKQDLIDAGIIDRIEQTITATEDNAVNELTVHMTDGTKYAFEVRNGSRGPIGPQGYSAYDIAVQHGFEGSEAEWNAAVNEARVAAEIAAANAKVSELAAKDSETESKKSETNAKASEEAAKQSETNAKNSELAAKDSETKANVSETNAKNSEIASKDSETKAKVSETNAKESETNSAVSETNAKASEQAAYNSSVTSANSATASANSASASAASETNAKTSELAAKESETNSKASELAAKTSETNADISADAAAISETNAKSSEEAAKHSETNSKASEESSRQSETNAKTSELAAKESETNAKASELAAKESETNAKASEEAAKQSETKSKASEEAAKQSETNANAHAIAAGNSATSAAISDNNSSINASNAAVSERNAVQSATNAAISEENASNSATNAAISEENASNSAASAEVSATVAINSARDAQANADNLNTDLIHARMDLKADGLYFDPIDKLLYLTSNGDTLGDGVAITAFYDKTFEYTISLDNLMDSNSLSVSESDTVILEFSYSSVNSEGITDGSAVGSIYVNKVERDIIVVTQGINAIDVTNYLISGINTIEFIVQNSEGNRRRLTYIINTHVGTVSDWVTEEDVDAMFAGTYGKDTI